MSLTFADPEFLWLLLLLPLLWIGWFFALKAKKKSLLAFSQVAIVRRALGPKSHEWKRAIIFYVMLFSLGMMVLALADPHLPLKQTKKGVNVVLALDVSGSMQLDDYKPTRLEAAKKSADILLESLDSKDHAGVVTFSSGASTTAFLSPFKDKVRQKLASIRQTRGETAIGDGLALAVDMATSIPNKKKIVIFLSDGVNTAGVISPDEGIIYAKANKVQVYTIGMGSEEPVFMGTDFFGRPQYSELDEATLTRIAQNTDGEYFKSVDDTTLDKIYHTVSEKIEREEEDVSVKNYAIALSGILLMLALYLQYGRFRITS